MWTNRMEVWSTIYSIQMWKNFRYRSMRFGYIKYADASWTEILKNDRLYTNGTLSKSTLLTVNMKNCVIANKHSSKSCVHCIHMHSLLHTKHQQSFLCSDFPEFPKIWFNEPNDIQQNVMGSSHFLLKILSPE